MQLKEQSKPSGSGPSGDDSDTELTGELMHFSPIFSPSSHTSALLCSGTLPHLRLPRLSTDSLAYFWHILATTEQSDEQDDDDGPETTTKKPAKRTKKKKPHTPAMNAVSKARSAKYLARRELWVDEPGPSPSKVTVVSDTESPVKPGQPADSDVIDLSPDSPTSVSSSPLPSI